jgi:hypothetical protein
MEKALKADPTKIIVEKLLIGAVILCLGIFTANRIEHFKSNQSFIMEFNKVRVQKLGEVWEQVYVWEALVQQNSERLNEILKGPSSNLDEIRQMAAQMVAVSSETTQRKKEVMAAANKNRFWIDEDQYGAITAYLIETEKNITELAQPGQSKEAIEQKKAQFDAARQKKRATFSAIRAEMLRE